ncbi:cysteine--tRNA ligase [Gloeobacter kilaueensis]|uniref:Cysteine--tRNA ligase n=1 Tax=Gloeobacter kilaueensis (strain ATCC BAA-2537 / CCAP 1431/1 / ULC 316 / JS1) TaxID=1183438 RepID=U5QF60_GLOK1|nr:cysteine--tRNA ligase [Gloeobacter kilaueensis]AGY57607.1 cysteinyl-tRNA synthetase [Gloeobacter kilaueensis JS1]
MALQLFNTLTRKKEPFVPIEPGKVRFYVCGVTVYDYSHLGHGRTYVVWDTIRRYLRYRGYEVTYVQNFTDIDDKILKRAEETGSSMGAVANTFIEAYLEDMEQLNILPADKYPRATQSLPAIERLIGELEIKGFAYPSDGDVYYRVRRFKDYGKLSGRRIEDLEAGASERVSEAEQARKEDPLDFALWKGAKPGEPHWDSAWGPGRPGWHIECSAMVRATLGETIDIHAGGEDLKFPHHENEIAQSEAITGKPLARYWLHNAFLNIVNSTSGEEEKMSKSLGNFRTLRDLYRVHSPIALRLFILQTHYRNPIAFSPEAIAAAENAWKEMAKVFSLNELIHQLDKEPEGDLSEEHVATFVKAMDDDFNTPQALAVLFDLSKKLITGRNIVVHGGNLDDSAAFACQWRTFKRLAAVLGLEPRMVSLSANVNARSGAAGDLSITSEAAALLESGALTGVPAVEIEEIERIIGLREQARQERNWGEADRLRQQLLDQGIILIDHKDKPTTWRRTES